MHVPTLYIVRGLPGSGKSTFARDLGGFAHFEADQFFYDEEGNYKFDPSMISRAHEVCQFHTERALMGGTSVVVANTFTTLKEIQPYVDLAKKYGALLLIHTCTGDYGSVHGVPEHTIERMRKRFVSHQDVLKHFGLRG